jgi:hypothetical protein
VIDKLAFLNRTPAVLFAEAGTIPGMRYIGEEYEGVNLGLFDEAVMDGLDPVVRAAFDDLRTVLLRPTCQLASVILASDDPWSLTREGVARLICQLAFDPDSLPDGMHDRLSRAPLSVLSNLCEEGRGAHVAVVLGALYRDREYPQVCWHTQPSAACPRIA